MSRVDHTAAFYAHLGDLEQRIGGKRTLADATGRMPWPQAGVYFFFEPGEHRSGSGAGPRVVHVGANGLTTRSGGTLWQRLIAHRGTLTPPGGNHRASAFRKWIGEALARSGQVAGVASWGLAPSVPPEVRAQERPLEQAVSRYIGAMPLLYLPVSDAPSPGSRRGYIAANVIALLSGYAAACDPPSPQWLGFHSPSERIHASGLWNSDHVDADYSPDFLVVFKDLIAAVPPAP